MKLASKEAIGLMLDREVLVNNKGNQAWFENDGFMMNDKSKDSYLIRDSWQTEGWELQKKHNPIPKEWTNDWANWRAVGKDGKLREFSSTPTLLSDEWKPFFTFAIISEGHDPTNWENSLESRTLTTGEQSILKRIERIEKALGL